jgi:hypothetical protein
MRVFLDDVRPLPADKSDWTLVKNYKQAVSLLASGLVLEISLDHDLGEKKTGYDVLSYIEEKVFFGKFPMPTIHIHTANAPARKKMLQTVEAMLSRTYAFIPEVVQ